MGSSMAMVGTGPMPGSTPISVPSRQPSRQYARFSSVSATEKPSSRFSNSSIFQMPSVHEAGPQREDEAQSLDEGAPDEEHEKQPVDECNFPAENVAGKAAEEYEQEDADVHPQIVQQQPAQHHAAKQDEHDGEGAALDLCFLGLGACCVQGDECAQCGQTDAQPEREIAGAHAGRRSHRVFRGTQSEGCPDHHEHDAGPEVLPVLDLNTHAMPPIDASGMV